VSGNEVAPTAKKQDDGLALMGSVATDTTGRLALRELHDLITRDEFRRFSTPSTARLVLDFSLVWSQAALGIAIFSYEFNIVGFVIGIILVGCAQHGMAQVAHEGVHQLIASGRKPLNDFIARWFFAAPTLLPFALYRHRHLAHHHYLGTDADTKEMYRRDIRGWRLAVEILLGLFGIDYIRQVLATLRRDHNDRGGEVARADAHRSPDWVRQEILPVATTQLILLGILSTINFWLYPLMWLLPIVTVQTLSGKIRSLVEHRPYMEMKGRKPGSGYYMDTEMPCLRSVQATFLERILISKVNFHFHAEHHLWPFVSYQYFPSLHQRLLNSPRAKEVGFTVEPSYAAAIVKLWGGK
jgi:fatty acid desaturase